MRSFALAALAFLTLGVFSFAAPTPILNDREILIEINDRESLIETNDHENLIEIDAEAEAWVKRADSYDNDKCLDSILHEVIETIEVVIDEISKLFF